MTGAGLVSFLIFAIAFFTLRWLYQKSSVDKHSVFLQHPFVQKLIKNVQQPIVRELVLSTIALIVMQWVRYTGWIAYRLTQPNAPYWDFKWFYTAGQLVHQFINPYNSGVFTKAFCQYTKTCNDIPPFIYPPNLLPPLWFLGYFSIEVASTIWVGLHLVTIVALLWGANVLLEAKSKAMRTTCTIACALIYGVVFDLRVGNISSLVAALVLWAAIFAKQERHILAGVLLGLSTVKPTLSILFLAYFLLKQRYTLVLTCTATSPLLTAFGLALAQCSPLEFLTSYKAGIEWTFSNLHSNIPEISPSRIDLGVIGYRLLPGQNQLAEMVSRMIIVGTIAATIIHLYQKRTKSNSIHLSDISVIACLGIATTYSQEHGSAMLIFSIVFLLKYLLNKIQDSAFKWAEMLTWFAGIGCLSIHTGIMMFRVLEPLKSAWLKGSLPYWFKVTIGTLPNYALLGLIIVTLILAKPQHKSI